MKSESQKFRYALLRFLANLEGDWAGLNDTMEIAKNQAVNGYRMTDLQYSTLKSARQAMKYEGLIDVRQGEDQHWEMCATDKGMAVIDTWTEPGRGRAQTNGQVKTPRPPFRVGMGHQLPPRTWKAAVDKIRDGEMDVIFIPHDKAVGQVDYWDE
jgi:hypothetical protein